MANRTDPIAKAVHGTNPQNLIDMIVRNRIYSSDYWKEHCFGLTSEQIVAKAMEFSEYGGTYGGNRKPTKFLCLIQKMLQIQPEKEIIIELLKNEEYRYVRMLGAFYLRLVGKSNEIYQYLEPLYNDYRKVRRKGDTGYIVVYIDEFIDELLTQPTVCDVTLPYLQRRALLEDTGVLTRRISALEEELEVEEQARAVVEEEKAKEDELQKRKEPEKWKQKDKKNKDREKEHEKEKEADRIKFKEMAKEKLDNSWYNRGSSDDKNKKQSRDPNPRDEKRRRDDYKKEEEKVRQDDGSRDGNRRDDNRRGEKRRNEDSKLDDNKKSKSDDWNKEIDDANALRATLGMKPLRVNNKK